MTDMPITNSENCESTECRCEGGAVREAKERPILFSGPMVRALLAGTKTQTRRVVKPQPTEFVGGPGVKLADGSPAPLVPLDDTVEPYGSEIRCPYGLPGDRLWVRESWSPTNQLSHGVLYRADFTSPEVGRWKPSIHMPRWASRILLDVTGVRVERLQDISEADARAEGAKECDPVSGREVLLAGPSQRGSFVLHYRDIWEQINGAGSWDANPWVWVVEFARATTVPNEANHE